MKLKQVRSMKVIRRLIVMNLLATLPLWVMCATLGRGYDMAVYTYLPLDGITGDDIRDSLNANGGSVTNDTTTFFGTDANINKYSICKPVDTGSVTHVKNMLAKGLPVVSPLTGLTVTVPYCFGAPNTYEGTAASPIGYFTMGGCEWIMCSYASSNLSKIVQEYDSYNSRLPYIGNVAPYNLGDFCRYRAEHFDADDIKNYIIDYEIPDISYNSTLSITKINLQSRNAWDEYYDGGFGAWNIIAYVDTSYVYAMIVKDLTTDEIRLVAPDPDSGNTPAYVQWGSVGTSGTGGHYYNLYPVLYSADYDKAVLLPQCDFDANGDYIYNAFPFKQLCSAGQNPATIPWSNLNHVGYAFYIQDDGFYMEPLATFEMYNTTMITSFDIALIFNIAGGRTYNFNELKIRWRFAGENATDSDNKGYIDFAVAIWEYEASGEWYWLGTDEMASFNIPSGTSYRIGFQLYNIYTDIETDTKYKPTTDDWWENMNDYIYFDYVPESGTGGYYLTSFRVDITYPLEQYADYDEYFYSESLGFYQSR